MKNTKNRMIIKIKWMKRRGGTFPETQEVGKTGKVSLTQLA